MFFKNLSTKKCWAFTNKVTLLPLFSSIFKRTKLIVSCNINRKSHSRCLASKSRNQYFWIVSTCSWLKMRIFLISANKVLISKLILFPFVFAVSSSLRFLSLFFIHYFDDSPKYCLFLKNIYYWLCRKKIRKIQVK